VLWKNTTSGITFPSPFGQGRPGWHTECVVFINELAHGLVDIHGGGSDLKFPHHENEIAQNRIINKTPLANYWVHNSLIDIDGIKMSKSLQNGIGARSAIETYGSEVVRFLLLSAPYRNALNITKELLEFATSEVNKIQNTLNNLAIRYQIGKKEPLIATKVDVDNVLLALADDLVFANAFKELDEVIKTANNTIRRDPTNIDLIAYQFNTITSICDLLGFSFKTPKLLKRHYNLYNKYLAAKEAKDYNTSDAIRLQLAKDGITI
jgi:cysteinyl-tRNA synthetase